MNLDGIDELINIVPQHYGDAVQLYPWIKDINIESHEWCNRTTIENAVWIIEHLNKFLKPNESKTVRHNECNENAELTKEDLDYNPYDLEHVAKLKDRNSM